MNQLDIYQFPKIYFRKMKEIEENLLEFLETQDEINESFNIFNKYIEEQKISENKYETKSFLHLIVSISNHYHRPQHFFAKIELILKSIQETIQNYFTNYEIFNIFQTSKRLLLFLFKFGILTPTQEIYLILKNNNKYLTNNYIEYFYPEFEQFIESSLRSKYSIKEDSIEEFNTKREKGENDHYICELIQNDSVVDFISYINKSNISFSSTIQQSIYETNLFLMNKNPSLIEYSIFYGSIQIFKYLFQQNVMLTSSIWPYAIHSKNDEIIHFIEDQKIHTLCDSFQYLIIESIKCHHNKITDYLRNNISEDEKIYNYFIYRKSLKFYNFAIFTDDIISSLFKFNIPYYLSKYDYYLLIEYLLKTKKKFNIQSNIKYKKNLIFINIQYIIYKPIPQKDLDIVCSIAIKNGDVNIEFKEEDDDYRFREMPRCVKESMTYFYDIERSTILNASIQKCNIDIIQLLIGQPKIKTNIKLTKIYKDIKCPHGGKYNEYYEIIEKKALAQEAVEREDIEMIQFLLKNGLLNVNDASNIKKTYHDCLSTAHMKYNEDCEKVLLHMAIEKGNIEIIRLLVSNPNIDINSNYHSYIQQSGGCCCYSSSLTKIDKSTLYFAIKYGNMEIIKLLLSNTDIDVNIGIQKSRRDDPDGTILKTPLYMAVENENLELVKLLLENPKTKISLQCSVEIKQDEKTIIQKHTALDLAISKNNIEMIQLLSKNDS